MPEDDNAEPSVKGAESSALRAAVNGPDDPISRSAITIPVEWYGRHASCSAFYEPPPSDDGSDDPPMTVQLSGLYPPQTEKYVTLTTFEGWVLLQCQAALPFSHTELITKTICDYRPKPIFTISQGSNCRVGVTLVSLTSQSSDRQGQIAKQEWFVDGAQLPTEGASLTSTNTSRSTEPSG